MTEAGGEEEPELSKGRTLDRVINFVLRKIRSILKWIEGYLVECQDNLICSNVSNTDAVNDYSSYSQSFDNNDRSILNNVLTFNSSVVKDVMTPFSEVFSVSKAVRIDSFLGDPGLCKYTRIPVYEDKLDNVVGFVHIKDIFANIRSDKDVTSVLRTILFVPPSMRSKELFFNMKSTHTYIAAIVDEYGCMEGIVSLKCLTEKIIGDIEDEHDVVENSKIIKISEQKYLVYAYVDIEEIEEVLDVKLKEDEDEDDYDSLSGFILSMVDRIPEEGEVVEHPSGIKFIINKADSRSIKQLTIDISNKRD